MTAPLESSNFVLGFYIQGLVLAFSNLGGDLHALEEASQQNIHEMMRRQDRINAEEYLALIESAQTLVGTENFGLAMGRAMQSVNFSELGVAVRQSQTLGQATEQVLALESAVHRLGHSQIIREPGSVRFVWHCHYQHVPQAITLTESVLSSVVYIAQALSARGVPLLEASFIHPEPKDQQAAYRRCFRSSCHFSQASNSLLFAEEVLAWPIQTAINHAGSSMTASSRRGLSTAALDGFFSVALADGEFQLNSLAKHFNVSSRTLQRHLERQGHSYQELLKQQRVRLCKDYLRYSDMSLHEISQLLGFKEQSSFNHFFSDCFETTPSKFRRAT